MNVLVGASLPGKRIVGPIDVNTIPNTSVDDLHGEIGLVRLPAVNSGCSPTMPVKTFEETK